MTNAATFPLILHEEKTRPLNNDARYTPAAQAPQTRYVPNSIKARYVEVHTLSPHVKSNSHFMAGIGTQGPAHKENCELWGSLGGKGGERTRRQGITSLETLAPQQTQT